MRIMWVVFSKEFLDIIRDRRRFILTLVSTFIVIPLVMLVPYAYLITRTAKQSMDTLTIPVQGMDLAPALVTFLMEEEDILAVEADDVEMLVNSKQYPVGLIIPDDFDEKVNSRQSVELIVVTDMRRTANDVTSTRLERALKGYGTTIVQARLKESGMDEEFFTPFTVKEKNAATSTETAGSLLGYIIPGLIMTIALNAGMPMAISSISGEKKKLTLEPVLFTTINRYQFVSAKLLAVLVSVLITMFSLALSLSAGGFAIYVVAARNLPMDKFSSIMNKAAADPASANPLAGGYHIEPLAVLLFLLAPFLIILLGAALQILVSTWARNDEEATTYLAPFSLFAGLVFMIPIFLDDYIPTLWHYGIPVFGTILSMRDLLSNKIDPASLTVMFGTTAFFAFLLVALAVWMFQREEVVFRT